MDMSTKYALNDTQVRHLAIICFREQDNNDAGVRACASQMCNYFEKYQQKNFKDVYECVFGSGWYWSKERNEKWIRDHPTVPQAVFNAVKDVIVYGGRTLPEYVVEYDQLADLKYIVNDGKKHTMEGERSYVLNRNNYHKDKTKMINRFKGAIEYTFYCFPDGAGGSCDAFGYINKDVPQKAEMGASEDVPGRACTWAEEIAADDSHGYSQQSRWGKDYDCSSLVISAYKAAGVPIDINKVYYTGNMDKLKDYGFVDVTSSCNLDTGSGMRRGDILYYHIKDTNGHTAMYCGDGKIVHARGQSYGSPATGDQGTEIAVTNYSRSQWQHVLRYGNSVKLTEILKETVTAVNAPEIRSGSVGSAVSVLQGLLDMMGYRGRDGEPLDIDGEFGSNELKGGING